MCPTWRDDVAGKSVLFGEHPPLLNWFSTPEELAQWGSPARRFPLDETQVGEFLRQTEGDDPKIRLWAGEIDRTLVAVAATTIDWHQGVALLGLVGVSPASRGRRLAHPFLQKVVANTFADERIERIELNVYTFNQPAIRTYERLGFVKEGIRRSLARMGQDRWDAAHYALLKGEFLAA